MVGLGGGRRSSWGSPHQGRCNGSGTRKEEPLDPHPQRAPNPAQKMYVLPPQKPPGASRGDGCLESSPRQGRGVNREETMGRHPVRSPTMEADVAQALPMR